MSARHILGQKKAPRVRLFADIKMVRELGLERCETVRSLSTVKLNYLEISILVREDRVVVIFCVLVVVISIAK